LGQSPMFRNDGFCEAGDIPNIVEFVGCRGPVWGYFGDSLEKDYAFPSGVECTGTDSMDRNEFVEFIEDMEVTRIARHVLCTAGVVKPFFRWRRLSVDREDSSDLWWGCWLFRGFLVMLLIFWVSSFCCSIDRRSVLFDDSRDTMHWNQKEGA
jgi:hypothetical protein